MLVYFFNAFICSLQINLYLIFQQVLQADDDLECLNTSYEQQYDGVTYRQVIRISSDGFQNYVNQNLQFASMYMQKAVFPDMTLSVGNIQMILTDIVVSDAQFPNCEATTKPQSQSLYIAIQGLNVSLNFQFRVQQQVYPYISDSGSGKIFLQNGQLTGDILEFISDTCIGAEQVNVTNFSLYINQLKIDLQSPNSYIYSGVLSLITSTLLSMFNTELQPVLQDAFLQVANQGIASGELYAFPHGQNNSVVEDQRFVKINVGDGYFDSQTMGTMCYIVDNVCTGSIPIDPDYPLVEQWSTNNDVQYFQSSDTFLSQFQVIYQQDLFPIKQYQQCDSTQFKNTGLVFKCYFTIDPENTTTNTTENVTFEFLAYINIKNVNIKSTLEILSVYGKINTWTIDKDVLSSEYINTLINQLNNVLEQTSPGINNGNYVNDKECYYKRWSDYWMQTSCNFDGSME